MNTIGNLCAIISANTANFREGMANCTADMNKFVKENAAVDRNLTQLSKKFTEFGKTLSVAVTLPITALGVTAVKAFDEQIKAEKGLEAALMATGQAIAPISADFKKFAKGIQDVTTVADEHVVSLMRQATLLGTTGDATKTAAKQAIGLAAAFGVSEDAAIRATASLAQGVVPMMLTRYIPVLKAIKDPTEKLAKANEILNNTWTQATTIAQEGLGPLTQLKNKWNDLQEQFGAIIAKGLTPLINIGKKVIEWFSALSEGTKKAIVVISGLAAAIGPLLLVAGQIGKVWGMLKLGFAAMISPIGLVVIGLAALVAGIIYLTGKSKELSATEKGIADVTDKYNDRLAEESAQVKILGDQLKATNPKSQERKNLIDKINSTYGTTLKNLSDEKAFVKQIDDAYDNVIKKLSKKILLQAQEETLIPILKEHFEIQKKINDIYDRVQTALKTQATTFDGVTAKVFVYDETTQQSTESLADLNTQLNENENAQKKITTETDKLIQSLGFLGDGTDGACGKTEKYVTALDTLKKEEEALTLSIQKAIDAGKEYSDLKEKLIANTKEQADVLDMYQIALGQERDTMKDISKIPTLILGKIEFPTKLLELVTPFTDAAIAVDSLTKKLAKLAGQISETVDQAQMIGAPLLSLNQILLDGQKQVSDEFLAQQDAKLQSISDAKDVELARIDELNISDAQRVDMKAAVEAKYAAQTAAIEKTKENERRKAARKQAIADKASAMFGATISGAQAVVSALKYGVAFAAIVGGLAAFQVGLIAAQPIPALAKGGIVKSETIARIGEAGPEAIVPLNQLKSEPMELTTRITAQDIELILKRRTKSLRFTNVE